jgi:hypothetical protein
MSMVEFHISSVYAPGLRFNPRFFVPQEEGGTSFQCPSRNHAFLGFPEPRLPGVTPKRPCGNNERRHCNHFYVNGIDFNVGSTPLLAVENPAC